MTKDTPKSIKEKLEARKVTEIKKEVTPQLLPHMLDYMITKTSDYNRSIAKGITFEDIDKYLTKNVNDVILSYHGRSKMNSLVRLLITTLECIKYLDVSNEETTKILYNKLNTDLSVISKN